MKKITFYAFICFINLATNPLAAMDECKENTNQRSYNGPVGLGDYETDQRMWCYADANNIIKKAVAEAVGNDPVPISLHVQEFEGLTGYCDSVNRVIGIDRRLAVPENSDSLAWNAFHEAAHLRDKITQKINFYGKACTILGGLLPVIAQRLLCKKPLMAAPLKAGLFGAFGACSSYLAFKKLGGELYCRRQGELRADKSAMERLLEKKKYTAVTYALKDKLTGIALGIERCDITHPTCRKECNNIIKTIRKKGYDVKYIYNKEQLEQLGEEQVSKLRKIDYWHFTPLTILCLLKNNQPVAYDASNIKLTEMKS